MIGDGALTESGRRLCASQIRRVVCVAPTSSSAPSGPATGSAATPVLAELLPHGVPSSYGSTRSLGRRRLPRAQRFGQSLADTAPRVDAWGSMAQAVELRIEGGCECRGGRISTPMTWRKLMACSLRRDCHLAASGDRLVSRRSRHGMTFLNEQCHRSTQRAISCPRRGGRVPGSSTRAAWCVTHHGRGSAWSAQVSGKALSESFRNAAAWTASWAGLATTGSAAPVDPTAESTRAMPSSGAPHGHVAEPVARHRLAISTRNTQRG